MLVEAAFNGRAGMFRMQISVISLMILLSPRCAAVVL